MARPEAPTPPPHGGLPSAPPLAIRDGPIDGVGMLGVLTVGVSGGKGWGMPATTG